MDKLSLPAKSVYKIDVQKEEVVLHHRYPDFDIKQGSNFRNKGGKTYVQYSTYTNESRKKIRQKKSRRQRQTNRNHNKSHKNFVKARKLKLKTTLFLTFWLNGRKVALTRKRKEMDNPLSIRVFHRDWKSIKKPVLSFFVLFSRNARFP